jgi:histidinol-phosphate aminotransferase
MVNFEYERVLTPESGLRLHLNENTAGCSPAVIAAMQTMTRHDVATYPDYAAANEACASRLGVDTGSLLLTNGLDEGILAIAVAGLRNGPSTSPFEAVVVVPAFDMYAACSDAAGGRVVEVPLGPGFVFPLERVLEAITGRTRVIWLTNPNNPTGQLIPSDAIAHIAAAAPGAVVMVDEAYADFSADTLIGSARLTRMPNIVVGRTFAKAYGLAGLRIGALVGDPQTLAPFRGVIPPYSVNACVAAVLPAALGDTAYFDWYLDQVAQSKGLLYDAFDRLGVAHWKSAANFVLARFDGDCGQIAHGLAARGVHVRDRSRDVGCAGCLRITAGVVDHTRAFIAALGEVL